MLHPEGLYNTVSSIHAVFEGIMKTDSRRLLVAGLSLCFSVLLLVARAVAQVATIQVPADQPSIQAAINAATNGDTVLVSPGTYTENINFSGKAITVTSASGPLATIIDGGATTSVVTFNSGEGPTSILSGFTIRNGQSIYYGGGIEISSASPTIIGNIITGNHGIYGIGIDVHGGSPLIKGNTITGNTQAGGDGGAGGGGIATWGSSSSPASPTIIGNTITTNSVSGGGNGGGISVGYYGQPTIQNNLISGNNAYNYGGGIAVWNYSGAIILQNVIINNAAGGGGSGGGIGIYASQNVVLVNNTINGNTAANSSSGIYVASGSPLTVTLANNIVVASTSQVAVECASTWSSSSPVFDDNDFYSATGSAYTGVCNLSSGSSNISVEPLFANPSSLDFHLSTGSPAIDAGGPTPIPLPTTDFDGNPRVVNGTVDMGAYEYQGATTFTVTPGSLSFAQQYVNRTSVPQTVTVTNTGPLTLHFHPMQVGADFTQSNSCYGPNGLATGQSCTVQVSFAPASSGTKSETLTITGANSASICSVTLNGMALADTPFGNLEMAVNAGNASSTTVVMATDNVWISGWVADPVDGAPLKNVALYIDGVNVGTPTLGVARTDVASYFNNQNYLNSGYYLKYSALKLTAGTHKVTVVATNADGQSATFGPLTITAISKPQGNLDEVLDASGATTVKITDQVFIGGWVADAADGAPMKNVVVYIDGVSIGMPKLGIARPDVESYFNIADYLNSGYTMYYPASNFSLGQHVATVIGTNSEGYSLTMGPSPFTIVDGPPVGNLELAVDMLTLSSTIPKADTLYMAGWAADYGDNGPAKSVTVFIDGTAVGAATIGQARSDVSAYFNKPSWLHSGWSFATPAASLAVGTHTVTAMAANSNRLTTNLGVKTITVQ